MCLCTPLKTEIHQYHVWISRSFSVFFLPIWKKNAYSFWSLQLPKIFKTFWLDNCDILVLLICWLIGVIMVQGGPTYKCRSICWSMYEVSSFMHSDRYKSFYNKINLFVFILYGWIQTEALVWRFELIQGGGGLLYKKWLSLIYHHKYDFRWSSLQKAHFSGETNRFCMWQGKLDL